MLQYLPYTWTHILTKNQRVSKEGKHTYNEIYGRKKHLPLVAVNRHGGEMKVSFAVVITRAFAWLDAAIFMPDQAFRAGTALESNKHVKKTLTIAVQWFSNFFVPRPIVTTHYDPHLKLE